MCCPHADSLARSPVHSCPLVFVRSSCARFGRARHSSAVIPPAMAGTQDSAPGPSTGWRSEEEYTEGENEDGAISLGLAERAPTDARVPRGLALGRGERGTGRSPRMGLEIAHAHRNPSRTNERACERASERATKGMVTNLLRSSSFLLLRSGWSRQTWSTISASAAFAECISLKEVEIRESRATDPETRAHVPFENIFLGAVASATVSLVD